MYNSKTITIPVCRPWRTVFEFLLEPSNLPTWATLPDPNLVHVGDTDWASVRGEHRTIIRFPPPNGHGILDHAIFPEGSPPTTTPMRAIANGDGTEIQYTLYQRAGMSDAQFTSEIEWLVSDLQALKTMLESDRTVDRASTRKRAGG